MGAGVRGVGRALGGRRVARALGWRVVRVGLGVWFIGKSNRYIVAGITALASATVILTLPL